MPTLPSGVDRRAYESDTARPLKPQLLSLALVLLFVDILAVVLLQTGGAIFGRRLGRAGAAAIAVLAIGAAAYLLAGARQRAEHHRAGQAEGGGRARHPGHRQGHLRLHRVGRCRPPTRPAGRA